jgi:hypothetical protein
VWRVRLCTHTKASRLDERDWEIVWHHVLSHDCILMGSLQAQQGLGDHWTIGEAGLFCRRLATYSKHMVTNSRRLTVASNFPRSKDSLEKILKY